MKIEIANKKSALCFLSRFEETSQFLINNLRIHGPVATGHHNSGNFKIIRSEENIVGVFCLTKRGNLLCQTSRLIDPGIILEECEKENHEIKGFIGEWEQSDALYQMHKEKFPVFSPSFFSREILYRIFLKKDLFVRSDEVRLLNEQDFDDWNYLNKSYELELGIPGDLTQDQRKADHVPHAFRLYRHTWSRKKHPIYWRN